MFDRRILSFLILLTMAGTISTPLQARPSSTIFGLVTDSLGKGISGAHVLLLYNGNLAATAASAPDGTFTFPDLASGRFQIEVQAGGFTNQSSDPLYISSNSVTSVDIALQIAPLKQELVAAATGSEMPQAQVGASVNVLDEAQLQVEDKVDLLESLREFPGLQVVQTGQRGGPTSIFVRGGDGNFNKVLIDGIPANDIGGAFDFGNLMDTGVGKVELMRGADSALYGTDAIESTFRITTSQGSSTKPELRYFADGGNFHTTRQTASLSGADNRVDYFGAFSRFDTQNSLPNDAYHNGTFSVNLGLGLPWSTTLRLTGRSTSTNLGLPGAYDFYGIANNSSQKEQETDAGLTLQNQTTASWHNLLWAGGIQRRYSFVNPSPAGTLDPFASGTSYLGQTVTIAGANGYNATGQAVIDSGGPYPETFDAFTKRRSLYAQSDYRLSGSFSVSAGFRYEHEYGWTDNGTRFQARRDSQSYFLEAHGNLHHRLYANIVVGLENDAIFFGTKAEPRASLAYYLRAPSPNSMLGSTRWTANFGTGIEEPSILDQGSSLFTLLSPSPEGQAFISKFGISAIGPERSDSFDAGVDQGLWRERVHLRGTFFDNRFNNLVEFINPSALPLLGMPTAVPSTSGFGAAVNSDSYRAKGAEAGAEIGLSANLHIQASYTYLDAVVTKSFSSSVIGPSFNPAFPNIPIGAFSPLVGGRPFRRSPNTANVAVVYSMKQWSVSMNGYFTGRSDDSTYLTDELAGNSLLLPNRNLNRGYQKVDLSGHYATGRYSVFFASVENVLNRTYSFPIGYPVLPLTFRTGVQFRLGGGQ